MEHRIAIIGTGLIGASIGLALRRSNPGIHICGFDSAVVLETALARGAISEIAESIEEAVSGAEIVIVATPISSVESVFKSMAPFLEVGAIVTDVCSVKCEIRDSARKYLPDYVTFVGGHPMAGSERTGPGHADELLLENATYVLCPPESVSFESFESYFTPLVTLLRSTGARLMLLTAEQHDRIAAVISHVPQLLAVALVNLAGAAAESDSELLALAAGGFRDMTRIASSPFTVWDPILRANRGEILEALAQYSELIDELKTSLASSDAAVLSEKTGAAFNSAATTRASVPERNKGFMRPLSDVFVFLTDEPGEVHKMTGVLSNNHINLKDIELLKIREGTGGTFRIGLESARDAQRALVVFRDAGMKAHVLT